MAALSGSASSEPRGRARALAARPSTVTAVPALPQVPSLQPGFGNRKVLSDCGGASGRGRQRPKSEQLMKRKDVGARRKKRQGRKTRTAACIIPAGPAAHSHHSPCAAYGWSGCGRPPEPDTAGLGPLALLATRVLTMAVSERSTCGPARFLQPAAARLSPRRDIPWNWVQALLCADRRMQQQPLPTHGSARGYTVALATQSGSQPVLECVTSAATPA